MVPSFAHTRMRRAEKGGPMQCSGPLSRRVFNKASRRRRHESAADDSNAFLAAVRAKGMKPVIHSKPERKKKHRLARHLYRQRYLVFRAIATRSEKTARNYLAILQVACAWLWLN